MKAFVLVRTRAAPALSWLMLGALVAAIAPSGLAATQSSARVTKVIKDVKLLPQQAAPRPATESENISGGTAVRTGTESRAELTFTDATIARLGANTIFSLSGGSHQVDLGSGAILVEVPPNGQEAKVVTASVTAAITGGTALFESHKKAATKFLVMEGLGKFYKNGHPGDAVILHGGEMVMMTADGRISRPATFNAKLVLNTSKLITQFSPLPNLDLIMAVIDAQQAGQVSTATNTQPNDTLDTTDQRFASIQPAAATSSKFGRPSVIKLNPYLINGTTLITTDPKITTNGQTFSGKIYRSPGQDGPFLNYLGTSPTVFDVASGEPSPNQALPLPVFLFTGLELNGDPKISTAGGGVSHLALVSQGGITFNVPAGVSLAFSNLDNVGLLALSGSVLTNSTTFANVGDLFMEARGATSDLILGGTIAHARDVDLVAERTVEVDGPINASNQFHSFVGSSFEGNAVVKANNIQVQALGSIHVSNTGQLLGLVNSTGTSGQVLLSASGHDTSIGVGGVVQADQGEVDIRHTGLNGEVNLDGATLRGDIVKVAALGMNGGVNIGAGNTINATTVLELFAPGSNGQLNFVSNVTLSSPANILAANTINIGAGVIVTINNAGNTPADVYTNHPNYVGFGGTGSAGSSGTFGGAGAHNPLPLSNAPPLGPPGGGR